MNKTLVTGIVGAMSLMAAPVLLAETGARLFQDWHYGQHIDEFPRSQGYYDCTSDLGEYALCHDDITFLQRSFQGQLMFNDDDTLMYTSVVADYSDDMYATLIGALVRSFGLVFAEGSTGTFDLVAHARNGTYQDEASVLADIAAFEREQLRTGYFGMSLVEQEHLDSMLGYSNAEEFLLSLPADVRAVDVYVYEDEYWGPTLSASFFLPGQQFGRFKDKAGQAPIEDF